MNINYFNNLSTGFHQMGEAIKDKLVDIHFTGLKDTPTGYSGGYYLQSTEGGIRYVSPTGLANDIGDEIVKTIVTGKLFDFTGLGDTPTGYSGGYYLQSTENGIRYVSSTGLADDIGDEIVKTIVTGKLFDFTGLGDTPADYSGGYYLQSTENGIRYISSTGLAEDISKEVTKTIVTGKLFDFTGLGDTPTGYSGGYYLQSTENGIRYISSTGLADDIGDEIVKTIVTGKLFDFTGLGDTPPDYSGGYYLQSTENGIRYVSSTGLAGDIGEEIVKTIVTGKLFDFTGLSDTPSGYKAYSDKFFVVPSGDRLVYDTVRFLENVSDAPTNQLVDGYLKLVQQGSNLVLQWSAGTTDGDVTYNIDGATHFTGLFDTPTGYKRGYYVRVKEDQDKLEYISSTGLAEDISKEVTKTIVTGKLFDFTGLGDTPADYSGGYYLQSTENGIRYISSTGLAEDISKEVTKTIVTGKLFDFTGLGDTPADYSGGYYLQSTENGIRYISSTGLAENISKEVTKTIVTGKLFDFTGLGDTPADYSGGYYLQSTENGIRYVSSTGLADDIIAGMTGIGGTVLKIKDTGTGIEFVEMDELEAGAKAFTGLSDTPADYSGGYYLQSTENGIRYISSTGLAENISKEVTKTIVTGKLFDFTGLGDTPADYSGGYYLQSTENGIRYVSSTGLADDIIAGMTGIGGTVLKIKDTGTGIEFVEMDELEVGAKAFTGLSDTPADYSGGYYLQSTENGIRYVSPTGLANDIGDEITQTIITGQLLAFTGLSDTPDVYYDGFYVRSTNFDIEYFTPGEVAEDLGDHIVRNIITGKLFDFTGLADTPEFYKSGYYTRSTSTGIEYISSTGLAEDISKEVTKTIVTGKLFDFTGLGDTPADYSGGYYLQSTENGIRYISSTGLAGDIGEEIVKTIVTGKLFDFTGLGDTPSGYKAYSDKFFVVPSGDRLVYDTVRFLENVSDAPTNQLVDGYLKLVQQGNDLVLQWSAGTTEGDVNYNIDGATHFTGLFDTPTGYKRGYYVRVKEDQDKLEYISSTGLAEDISKEVTKTIVTGKLFDFTGLGDTPADYSGGYYVQSTDNGIRYISSTGLAQDISAEVIKTIVSDKLLDLTGLADTPNDYSDGHFLQATDDGFSYISTDDLADELDDKVVQNIVDQKLLHFTGLGDTPANYKLGQYLRSTDIGIEYVTSYDAATDLGSIPKQYKEGFNYEGQIVNSGCDLYFVCDGNWEKLSSYDGKLDLDTQDIPACVDTVEELAVYEIYKENFVSENMNSVFDFQLQDDISTVNDVYNVCLFSSDSNSKVAIQETSYKWGMFNGSQTINLRALPGQNAGFSHWTGYGASFSDPLNASASVLVDKDLSITGVFNGDPQFNGTFNFTPVDGQYLWDYRLMTNNAYQYELFGFATALSDDMMVVGSIDGSSSTSTSGGSIYPNGRGTVRLHTFKKDSSTNNMFVEVAVQHEPFLNDTGSGYVDFMYGSAWDMDGDRLVRILDNYPYFRPSLGHNVDPELAALVSDKQNHQCGAVEVLKWTGTRWAREAMLFPKMRDVNSGDLLADYRTFDNMSPSNWFSVDVADKNYVNISGGKIYVSTRQEGVGAIFELQNNGEWIQTETINWASASQSFYNPGSSTIYYGLCPMFAGDYMLAGHGSWTSSSPYTVWSHLGLYKKNAQGIMEAQGRFILKDARTAGYRYKNGILMQSTWSTSSCSNCTTSRPSTAYSHIYNLDIDNLTVEDLGVITASDGINARNLPSMGNSYWSAFSSTYQQMATNGEIFTIGWSWNGDNNFAGAGNVFVYTRS